MRDFFKSSVRIFCPKHDYPVRIEFFPRMVRNQNLLKFLLIIVMHEIAENVINKNFFKSFKAVKEITSDPVSQHYLCPLFSSLTQVIP